MGWGGWGVCLQLAFSAELQTISYVRTNEPLIICFAGASGGTIVYDPYGQRTEEWKHHMADTDDLTALVHSEGFPQEHVRMAPWDIMLKANPVPHEVTPITAGDQLVVVGFVGLRFS